MIHMFQNRAIRISKGNELLFQLFADWGNITTWSTLRERLYLIPKGCFQLLSLLYQVGQFFVSLGSARERIYSSFRKTPKAKSEHRCENSLKSCAWIFYDLCWGEFLWVNKIMFMDGNRPFPTFLSITLSICIKYPIFVFSPINMQRGVWVWKRMKK